MSSLDGDDYAIVKMEPTSSDDESDGRRSAYMSEGNSEVGEQSDETDERRNDEPEPTGSRSSSSDSPALAKDDEDIERKSKVKKVVDLISNLSDMKEEPPYDKTHDSGCVWPPHIPPADKPHRDTNQLRFLRKAARSLSNHPMAKNFEYPVRVTIKENTDYHKVVSHPMCLQAIRRRLNKNWYFSGKECIRDFMRIFSNCYLYHKPNSDMVHKAQTLEGYFMRLLEDIPEEEIEFPIEKKTRGKAKKRKAADSARK